MSSIRRTIQLAIFATAWLSATHSVLAIESYASWLNTIGRPNQVFLIGANQNDYYVAVLQRGVKHIAVCVLDLAPHLSRNSTNTQIVDVNGNSVIVSNSFVPLTRQLHQQVGDAKIDIIRIDGKEYPLVDNAPQTIRIIFSSRSSGNEYSVAFDKEVELQTKGKNGSRGSN